MLSASIDGDPLTPYAPILHTKIAALHPIAVCTAFNALPSFAESSASAFAPLGTVSSYSDVDVDVSLACAPSLVDPLLSWPAAASACALIRIPRTPYIVARAPPSRLDDSSASLGVHDTANGLESVVKDAEKDDLSSNAVERSRSFNLRALTSALVNARAPPWRGALLRATPASAVTRQMTRDIDLGRVRETRSADARGVVTSGTGQPRREAGL